MNAQNKNIDDYDSPWKEGMDLYFKELMEFFFPEIASEIAWNKGYEFLDKELQSVVRDAEIGRRHADKLVKVWSVQAEQFHGAHSHFPGRSFKSLIYKDIIFESI